MQNDIVKPNQVHHEDIRKTVFHDLYAHKNDVKATEHPVKHYAINILAFVFSFGFPLFGFVVWILFRSDRPKDAIFPLVGVIMGWLAIFIYRWIPMIYAFLG
jgi:hypothetical protein